MILINANRDGTVSSTPSLVPQGSAMQDIVIISDYVYAYCTLKLTPASGLYIPDILCTLARSADGQTVWTASLPAEAAAVPGVVSYQLIFTAADGTRKGTLEGSLTVPRGAITTMPDTVDDLEQKTVNDLYTLLANIYAVYEGLNGELDNAHSELTEAISTLTGLKSTVGYINIPTSEWSDKTPTQATVTIPGISTNSVTLLVPMDTVTQTEANAGNLVVSAGSVDDNDDTVIILRGDTAPRDNLIFAYITIRGEIDDGVLVQVSPVVSFIGLSGSGSSSSGGVDSAAVTALIEALVPSWAREDDPPEDAVQSVNGQTGAVELTAEDVGARADTWLPTTNEIGADSVGTATAAVMVHNVNTDAHNDLRTLINGLSGDLSDLTDRLDALANSDDETLDQLAEIVAYIKDNRNLIDAVTSGKISYSDLVTNYSTDDDEKPLAASVAVKLKSLIDQLDADKVERDTVEALVTAALATAKASGDFDGEDGEDGVSPTITVSKSGTTTTITVTNADGSTTTSTVEDGEDGEDADSSAIQASLETTLKEYVDTLLGYNDLVGEVGDGNVITLSVNKLSAGTYTLRYLTDDGETYAEIGTLTVTSDEDGEDTVTYTNQISSSVDTDGTTVYNGTGYMVGKRLNYSGNVSNYPSDGVASPTLGVFVTGFIPVQAGDIIHLENCYIDPDGTAAVYGMTNGSGHVLVYTTIGGTPPNVNDGADLSWSGAFTTDGGSKYYSNFAYDDSGNVVQFTVDYESAAYIRLTLAEGVNADKAVLWIERNGVAL